MIFVYSSGNEYFFVLIRSNILLKFIISGEIKVYNRLMNKVESRAKPLKL